ncbi:hypothetical protein [Maribellus mangrovi]|uniref:hypothetical protein n=1 Tax=Maribellus mangrovi TaxID=3133146 RepID=UPI0030EF8FFF
MENQDFNKEFHSNLNIEFQKIDKFLKEFRHEFTKELSSELELLSAGITSDETLKEKLLVYSNQIFNSAESVIDKDKHYTEVRLIEELETMSRVSRKDLIRPEHLELAERTHRKAKALMVKFYPNLIDLSANGFRLLEKYCSMYNHDFVLSLLDHA